MYHLVDVVHSNNQSFEDMGTLLSFLQVVLGATDGHLMAVLNEVADAFTQAEQLRTHLTMSTRDGHQSDIVYRERALQSRHLEQLIQNHVGIGIALAVNHDTHTLTA